MQSVFTPIQVEQYPHTLKTTMSAQEWCGHTFVQFNLEKNAYRVTGLSYFESEGDIEEDLSLEILEDELWNLIRLAPDRLPIGNHDVIPGTVYSRLVHKPQKPQQANLSLAEEGDAYTYTINYPKDRRSLAIRFEKAFPHQILGWEETYSNAYGKSLTTRGTLMETLHTAYWGQNSNRDEVLRGALGLE